MFDSINYLKGSSVIRMLSAHLGVRVFLQGASEYLKAHAYGELSSLFWTRSEIGLLTLEGNATTNDLWSALSEVSGTDVRSFMVGLEKCYLSQTIITLIRTPGCAKSAFRL